MSLSCAADLICATLVNIQTHTQTGRHTDSILTSFYECCQCLLKSGNLNFQFVKRAAASGRLFDINGLLLLLLLLLQACNSSQWCERSMPATLVHYAISIATTCLTEDLTSLPPRRLAPCIYRTNAEPGGNGRTESLSALANWLSKNSSPASRSPLPSARTGWRWRSGGSDDVTMTSRSRSVKSL